MIEVKTPHKNIRANSMGTIMSSGLLGIGDVFQIPGRYKKRSFFGWLYNGERELKDFRIIASPFANDSYKQYIEI